MSNVFYNNFEDFDRFDTDLTLENVNPRLLIAVYYTAA